MLRAPIAIGGASLLLAVVAAAPVQADELPAHKAGYWEMKTAMGPADAPISIAGHMCVDADSEKKAGYMIGEKRQQKCSKFSVQKTANGYIIDKVCSGSTNHIEITGNFESAYTMKDAVGTTEAKWLGACPAGWKPGETEVAGEKVNTLADAE